jgi:hypothetical protein
MPYGSSTGDETSMPARHTLHALTPAHRSWAMSGCHSSPKNLMVASMAPKSEGVAK